MGADEHRPPPARKIEGFMPAVSFQAISKTFATPKGPFQALNQVSLDIEQGDKIGLIGPNGAGKTTLLKLILGALEPDSGHIQRGANLQVAYFDQMRAALDLDATLEDFISPGSEWIEIGSRRQHVKSYLGDFLFSPARAASPVRSLSGGERNRLLLARLFARPANVLVLDEPTNDLDVETLELLEELIDGYQGTVMLVSHDRQFVDNTVTECWIFEGGGRIGQYVGGYHDARGQQAQSLAQKQTVVKKTTEVAQPKAETVKRGGNKLSYNLQRELEQLPQKLEALEAELQTLQDQVADPDFFGQPHDRTQQVLAKLAEAEQALEAAFERWEYLEGLKNGA